MKQRYFNILQVRESADDKIQGPLIITGEVIGQQNFFTGHLLLLFPEYSVIPIEISRIFFT